MLRDFSRVWALFVKMRFFGMHIENMCHGVRNMIHSNQKRRTRDLVFKQQEDGFVFYPADETLHLYKRGCAYI